MERWFGLALLGLLLTGCSAAPSPPKELYNRLLNVRSLAFSPDGAYLVAGRSRASGGEADLMIWDQGGRGALKEVPAHPRDVVAVTFLSGNSLLSAGAEGQLKFWNTSGWTAARSLPGQRWVVRMAVTDKGSSAVVLRGGGRDTMQPRSAQVELWDLEAGSLQRSFPTPDATDLAVSSAGDLIATLMTDASVKLWKCDGTEAGHLNTRATSLEFSPDGLQLATGGTDGVVTIWDAAATSSKTLPGLGERIIGLRFSADGKRLAYGSDSHLVLSSEGKVLWDRAVDGYASPSVIAFSADGTRLATAGASKVLLWSDL